MDWYWVLFLVFACTLFLIVAIWVTIRLSSRDWGEPGTVAATRSDDPFNA